MTAALELVDDLVENWHKSTPGDLLSLKEWIRGLVLVAEDEVREEATKALEDKDDGGSHDRASTR